MAEAELARLRRRGFALEVMPRDHRRPQPLFRLVPAVGPRS